MPDKNYFLLIKKDGFSAKGMLLDAETCAKKILDVKFWPLWPRTRNKHNLNAGDEVLVYLAGTCVIYAKARIKQIDTWNRQYKKDYPLMLLDGEPNKVLVLEKIEILKEPVKVKEKLNKLSFIPKNTKKWGVTMMGGVRQLQHPDYVILS